MRRGWSHEGPSGFICSPLWAAVQHANILNSGDWWNASSNMAAKKQRLASPPRPTPLASSPPLSAVRSSPLVTGSLPSYPATASSFSSSPVLSCTQRDSSASPDYFDNFVYHKDMDVDLRRIDLETGTQSSQDGRSSPTLSDGVRPSYEFPPYNDGKTWVVFRGKVPGIYADGYASPSN